jgi:hypothetical protein
MSAVARRLLPCAWMHGEGAPAAPRSGPDPAEFQFTRALVAAQDDGTARHWERLRRIGVTRLIDAHTHWFPESVNAKIWAYFDRHYWPVLYRDTAGHRLEWMRRNGVHRFTTLTYAHRPGMAAWLNAWTAEFAAGVPEAIPCGTFFPEPEVGADVRRCIEEYRFRGFKLHLRVGDFDPSSAALYPAFEQIEAAGLPVVIHAGSAPDPGTYTAPVYLQRLMLRFPQLKIVVAHMGSSEFEDYVRLALAHESLYLDTTMVFVGFSACDPFPDALLPQLETLSHKVLFGSDFPTIPYTLSHAIAGVLDLPVSDAAKRRMFCDNAARLFGVG